MTDFLSVIQHKLRKSAEALAGTREQTCKCTTKLASKKKEARLTNFTLKIVPGYMTEMHYMTIICRCFWMYDVLSQGSQILPILLTFLLN